MNIVNSVGEEFDLVIIGKIDVETIKSGYEFFLEAVSTDGIEKYDRSK